MRGGGLADFPPAKPETPHSRHPLACAPIQLPKLSNGNHQNLAHRCHRKLGGRIGAIVKLRSRKWQLATWSVVIYDCLLFDLFIILRRVRASARVWKKFTKRKGMPWLVDRFKNWCNFCVHVLAAISVFYLFFFFMGILPNKRHYILSRFHWRGLTSYTCIVITNLGLRYVVISGEF